MMLSTLVVFTTLQATTSWSVAVTRRVGVDAARAADVAEQLTQALDAVPNQPLGTLQRNGLDAAAAAACAGSLPCVAGLGKAAAVDRVVALQLVKLGGDLAFDATVLDVQSAASLGAVTETIPSDRLKARLAELATRLAAMAPRPAVVVAPAPQPQPDAPLKESPEAVALAPAPSAPPLIEAKAATPVLRYVSYGAAGAAVVAAGIGAVLGVMALSQSGPIRNTDSDFHTRREAVLGIARGADVSYGVAGALAATAIITFVLSMRSTSAESPR